MIALDYDRELAPVDRAELLERRSYECYLTDQIDKAIEARLAALKVWRDLGDSRKEGDTLRWLSRLSWFTGRGDAAERYATEAIAVLERLSAGPELAMAYSNRAQLDMLASASSSAVKWARKAIDLIHDGHHDILSHALNNLGTARVFLSDLGGWEDLERSLRIALEHGLHEHAARAFTNLMSSTIVARRYAMATRWLDEGMSYCERRDLDSWYAYMLAWRARARFEQGDWSGATEDAEAVLRSASTAPISRIPALIVLAHVRVRRGDPDVTTPLQQVRELVTKVNELQRSGPFASMLAEAAWLADDLASLVREVQPVFELSHDRADAWTRGELASWLWRAKALNAIPDQLPEPYLAEMDGDWREAADLWEELGCPYERACMLAWYGAETEKLEALATFEALGAQPAAQKLRKTLRDQGVRGVPRGARTSTRTNEYGLTKREAQILELLSQGLRNAAIAKRLFLSTKTVDHHVSSILNKLGVPSRAEAIAMTRTVVKSK
jgi:DNA-binding CsgD family transcriptional regulator